MKIASGGLADRRKVLLGGALVLFLFGGSAHAQRGSAFVTIYEGGFALVQEMREVAIGEGVTTVALTDLPVSIDPGTVAVTCLSSPGKVTVRERSFSGRMPDPYSLLGERCLGTEVRVITSEGKVHEGVLAGYTADHVALMVGEEMVLINRKYLSEVSLQAAGLASSATPSLLLTLASEEEGVQRLRLDYITEGMGWSADYSLLVGPKGMRLDGWVSIDNRSGADYRDVSFRLVSGGVRRNAAEEPAFGAGLEMKRAPAYERAVRERPFADYHVYDIERRASFEDGELKQVKLFAAPDVHADKEYTYEGGSNARVNYLFVNSAENGLAVPLPAGKIGVYEEDASGKLLFLGEDRIERSAEGEKVRIYIGDAFDIVGEKIQLESKPLTKRSREETYQIELRNHKDEKADVVVVEKLMPDREWKMVSSSHEWKKKDARTIEFPLSIAAHGEETLKYTVLYRW